LKQLSKHLSFANAISCIALFVALSGAAYAASTTLGKKSVKTQNLANSSVTTLKLKGGAVTNLKLRNGAVTGAKIANGTIGSTQLANGAVRSAQLGGSVVTESKLKNGAVTTEKLASGVVTSAKLSSTLSGQLVKNVSYVTASSPSNEELKPKSVTVQCPSGKQVTGGGAKVNGTEAKTVAVTESIPALNGESKRTGWTATAAEVGGAPGKPWAVEAFAICAEL
jgi:trimeric autotransporter adhesin